MSSPSPKRADDAQFSRADVARIARLARLELTEAEIDLYQRQLTGILEYAQRIQDVDTNGVEPYASTLLSRSDESLRSDVAVTSLSSDDALRNAPQADHTSGTYVVPKVIG